MNQILNSLWVGLWSHRPRTNTHIFCSHGVITKFAHNYSKLRSRTCTSIQKHDGRLQLTLTAPRSNATRRSTHAQGNRFNDNFVPRFSWCLLFYTLVNVRCRMSPAHLHKHGIDLAKIISIFEKLPGQRNDLATDG